MQESGYSPKRHFRWCFEWQLILVGWQNSHRFPSAIVGIKHVRNLLHSRVHSHSHVLHLCQTITLSAANFWSERNMIRKLNFLSVGLVPMLATLHYIENILPRQGCTKIERQFGWWVSGKCYISQLMSLSSRMPNNSTMLSKTQRQGLGNCANSSWDLFESKRSASLNVFTGSEH